MLSGTEGAVKEQSATERSDIRTARRVFEPLSPDCRPSLDRIWQHTSTSQRRTCPQWFFAIFTRSADVQRKRDQERAGAVP
jgi:hypothetical protein